MTIWGKDSSERGKREQVRTMGRMRANYVKLICEGVMLKPIMYAN